MKLCELKKWINSLPTKCLQYEVVNGQIGKLVEDYEYRLDKPVVELMVDEPNKEIVIFNEKK